MKSFSRLMLKAYLAAVPAIFLPTSLAAQSTMVPWVTRSADNARSGWNSNETILNQASITNRGIVRTTIIPVVGDKLGMEAQPLILPQVQTARGVRDVMVLPSMADVVRGVDAHDGTGIWQTTLGTPLTASAGTDYWFPNMYQHFGCISTGVIDAQLKRLYQVCMVLPNAQGTPMPAGPASTNPGNARYFMFVLNVADGTLVVPPVLVEGTSNGQDFDTYPRKQRASLVETNINGVKTVFGCSGTFQETGTGAAGWCFAFDVKTNKVTTMLATTAGVGAGIWMAGQGPAADADGNLYVITGNGDFDGKTLFGESILKIKYNPPVNGEAASLAVVDHWTPWTDDVRSGGAKLAAGKLAGLSAPSAKVRPVGGGMNMPVDQGTVQAEMVNGKVSMRVYPAAMATGDWSDEDWGSAGPACIFALGVCIAGGKDGIAYPVSTAQMGDTTPADLNDPSTNCKKLAGPPVWLTMDPGQQSPCPADPTTLNFFPGNNTAHLHMTPVQYYDPVAKSWTIFAWGENNQLHKWSVAAPGVLTYVAQGNEFASVDVRSPVELHGGMPGGFCSGSSHGADPNSALLVCTIPYGDANQQVTNGRLLIYDPVHIAQNGTLTVLWDSQRWGIPFQFNKFNPPVIDGGQIYVPNYNGGVDVYTLAPVNQAAVTQ
jgi:hypothetical protein